MVHSILTASWYVNAHSCGTIPTLHCTTLPLRNDSILPLLYYTLSIKLVTIFTMLLGMFLRIEPSIDTLLARTGE
jgi:hypothetical protein